MGFFTNLLGRIGGSPASVSNDRPADDLRTERSDLNRGPTPPQRNGEENSIAGSTANHNADKTAATAKSHAEKGSETLESFLTEARDSAQKLTQDVKNVHAQLGRRNHASSPGKQKIMAKSIQSAYPMAGAAAFAAFGVMLLAAGPFGALMGIALAYGAYAIHSAIKQHQEAQREMQDEDGNEGEGAGRHNSGIEQSQNSQPSSASGNKTEPESGEGGAALVAGDNQNTKLHGNINNGDKPDAADDDDYEDDGGIASEPAAAVAKGSTGKAAHITDPNTAGQAHSSPRAATKEASSVHVAQDGVSSSHENAGSAASAAESRTQDHAETASATPAPATTAASTGNARREAAPAAAPNTHAQM